MTENIYSHSLGYNRAFPRRNRFEAYFFPKISVLGFCSVVLLVLLLAFVLSLPFLPILLIELFLKNLFSIFLLISRLQKLFCKLFPNLRPWELSICLHFSIQMLTTSKQHVQNWTNPPLNSVLLSCSLFLYLMTPPSYFPPVQNLGLNLTSSIFLILHIWLICQFDHLLSILPLNYIIILICTPCYPSATYSIIQTSVPSYAHPIHITYNCLLFKKIIFIP